MSAGRLGGLWAGDETSLTGRLLLATPGLHDPNFARSVVLVLAHTEVGALGVVLNRPGGLPVVEVLPQLVEKVAAPEVVFIGGPVQPDTALCLGSASGGWRTVDVHDEADLDAVGRFRLFAAYAGWSTEQLEAEIAAGGWYVVEPWPDDPFTDSPEDLWRRVLRRQRGSVAFASTSPDDPTHN